ncbi:M48 family metallopeptidase [Algimonas porphyrae]|uniref:Protease HtpX n=1 Tax=Algimonas porphyrae TaxID=1128113 RepID=A0ABQ5UYT8_9PROT|nr:M48 family metallopeptidase [Algimonas porphyrae]GLQ19147.1 protease HtpX [Algimonas porphyrae]
MLIGAAGLRTHIWNNNLRSILLLAFFPVLLLLMFYGLTIVFVGMTGQSPSLQDGLSEAAAMLPTAAPFALGASGIWFGIAFFGHNAMINAATRAKPVTQSQEPRAYRMLENLAISRGLTMPRLMVMETPALNAFASGIRPDTYQVTLTRGLMDRLDDEELEAVIAHELSHIMHKDVRMLIIAVIFVGIFAFVGETLFRNMFRVNFARSRSHRRSGGGNAGVLILVAFAIVALTYVIALMIRFTMSRKREYMADAGAVELTKNPDAMIRALQKISANPELETVPDEVREMALYNPRTGLAGLFTTHPPIEKRIDALVTYGGGRVGTQSRMPRTASPDRTPSGDRNNPWR